MSGRRLQQYALGSIITVLAALICVVVPRPFDALEEVLLKAEYSLRGELRVDPAVVVLYLNNADIAGLGGWPLKRSYYALLIDALNDLGAKSIGIDIAFTEPDIHGPEYDDLLASVMRRSGNVVLGGYFGSIDADAAEQPPQSSDTLLFRFAVPAEASPHAPRGGHLMLPIRVLLDAAAGFGHTNLHSGSEIPLFIRNSSRTSIPAFAYAVLVEGTAHRVGGLSFPEGIAQLEARGVPAIQNPPDEEAFLNAAGNLSSLNMVPAVEFLKSYDLWKEGGHPPISVEAFREKIVLVGVIAEGRGPMVETPFSRQFPAIGVHATFLENALHGNFLRKGPVSLRYLLPLLIGLLCTATAAIRRTSRRVLSIAGLMILLILSSYMLFARASFLLPVVPTIFTGCIVAAGLLIQRQYLLAGRMAALEGEKKSIAEALKRNEAKLEALEAELAAAHKKKPAGSAEPLVRQIEEYESEAERLQELAADLRPAGLPQKAGARREFDGIIYNDAGPMQPIVSFIEKIADSDATVLLSGESGTGKELVARALHERSRRKRAPFVTVNCGALSETLLESELFGHERGAFTGAVREKRGRFELAGGGTIFLDEIGEISEQFQVKLLRVLQDGTFERVGGNDMKHADVRIIAATNRDLRSAVREMKFREDLYYRVNVLSVHLPPLRDRKGDIPLLVEHVLSAEASGMKCSAGVLDALECYGWKGNIRELQSVLRRAILLAGAEGRDLVRMKDLTEEIVLSARKRDDPETRILALLREKKFSHTAISDTAEDLGGLNRGTVAEYFRGCCFKTFAESQWDIQAAAQAIAGSGDASVRDRVRAKLEEYLINATEFVDRSMPLDMVKARSRSKYKNLPKRYFPSLDAVIASAYHNEWSPGATSTEESKSDRLK